MTGIREAGRKTLEAKERNTGRDSSTQPNPHIDALTHTRPVEGR